MVNIKNNKAFMSLLGLLLSIAIIVFVAYKVYNLYLKSPSMSQETRESLSSQGIDTSSQAGAFQSTKQKVSDINKVIRDRANQFPE